MVRTEKNRPDILANYIRKMLSNFGSDPICKHILTFLTTRYSINEFLNAYSISP